MLLYTNLQDQLDEQFPSLASRARKTLAKACYPTLIPGLLSDLLRSRTDLIVENALLRQQLIVLNCPAK